MYFFEEDYKNLEKGLVVRGMSRADAKRAVADGWPFRFKPLDELKGIGEDEFVYETILRGGSKADAIEILEKWRKAGRSFALEEMLLPGL